MLEHVDFGLKHFAHILISLTLNPSGVRLQPLSLKWSQAISHVEGDKIIFLIITCLLTFS